jgi:hypothetical protein
VLENTLEPGFQSAREFWFSSLGLRRQEIMAGVDATSAMKTALIVGSNGER